MIAILLTIVQVVVCLFLILVVLLQQGKSADWSGTFGGGSSQTAFGQRGTATLLSKLTTAAAIIFMVNSMALTIVYARPSSRSIIPAGTATPVTPAAAPADNKATETPATPPATPAPEATKEAPPAAPPAEKSK